MTVLNVINYNESEDCKKKLPETLCFSCMRANAIDCHWIGQHDKTGLIYVEKFVPAINKNLASHQISVIHCRNFKKGIMPPPYHKKFYAGINDKLTRPRTIDYKDVETGY